MGDAGMEGAECVENLARFAPFARVSTPDGGGVSRGIVMSAWSNGVNITRRRLGGLGLQPSSILACSVLRFHDKAKARARAFLLATSCIGASAATCTSNLLGVTGVTPVFLACFDNAIGLSNAAAGLATYSSHALSATASKAFHSSADMVSSIDGVLSYHTLRPIENVY